MTKLVLTVLLSLFLLNNQGNGQCNPTCPTDITTHSDAGQCGAIVSYTTPSVPQGCGGTKTTTDTTFFYTGNSQTFTVPAGVNLVTIKAWGAQGGANYRCGTNNALGGYAQGSLPVTANDVLHVFVGGQPGITPLSTNIKTDISGGYNGGGTHGVAAGGGGGGSDVRVGDASLTSRVIVAGGGGGNNSDCNSGGAGGGSQGGTGESNVNSTYFGGSGGTQTAGGGAGYYGNAGSSGSGGNGDQGFNNFFGAGGGGGYYGGGSADFAGAGGGSGYIGGVMDGSMQTGVNFGDGKVEISYQITTTPSITQTAGLPSGSLFPLGTTINTFTIDDGNGNTTTCSFNVTVTDNEKPFITSCAPAQSGFANGNCSETVPDFTANVTATDNCTATSDLVITQDPAAGTSVSTGSTPVTITVTDASGNFATCGTTFTVTDNINPVITACSPAQSTSADANCSAKVPDFTANVTVADNCTATSDLVITQDPAAGTSVSTGSTPVTITVTDASGNYVTCGTTFTVTDNTAPSIACPANITLSACQSTATWSTPTATDNCSGVTVDRTAGPASGSTFANGTTTTITYTATDASNNKISCSFTVTRAAAIGINISKTNATCSGQSNGSITVTASGGKAPYQYKINTCNSYQSGRTFSNLAPVNYTITVKDADNCTYSVCVTINSNVTIKATITAGKILCNGSKTTLTTSASGGKPSYQYKLINASNGSTVANYQNSKTFTIGAGTYKVIVKDHEGCEGISNTLTVSQPSELNIVKASQTNVNCKGGADGKVTVRTSGGRSPYQYKINTCSSYQTSATFSKLKAGSYTITAKDDNGCTKSISITITQPSRGCTNATDSYEITQSRREESKAEDTVSELEVKVSPNPSTSYFTLIVKGSSEKAVEIRVLDMLGRTIYTTKGSANDTYYFGGRFTGGTYIVQVIQGQSIKTVKVIKGN